MAMKFNFNDIFFYKNETDNSNINNKNYLFKNNIMQYKKDLSNFIEECNSCPSDNDNSLDIDDYADKNIITLYSSDEPIKIDLSEFNKFNDFFYNNKTETIEENNDTTFDDIANKNDIDTDNSCGSCPEYTSIPFTINNHDNFYIFTCSPKNFINNNDKSEINEKYILLNAQVVTKESTYTSIEDKIIVNTGDKFQFKIDDIFYNNLFVPFIFHAECIFNGKIITKVVGYSL